MLENLNAFEMNLDLLLQNRAATGGVYRAADEATQKPFGTTVAYLGLLFAVLASGCQSSDLPSKERELTSQVYGRSLSVPVSLADQSSMLLVSMSANDEFPFSTHDRRHSDASGYRQCVVIQHESRHLLCATR